MKKPLAIDLCCGLGGWTEGLLDEGYDVIGFDVERHAYGSDRYPAQLVLQNILTIDGRQFKGKASLIVASPPCQEYSWMAMPWSRAKQVARALRGQDEFPKGYRGSRTLAELTALFDACIRIGKEAECPVVIENVRGAQPWVGKARANYGSFYLWGDVPALMPIVRKQAKVPGFRFDGSGKSFQTASVQGTKTLAHVNRRDGHGHTRHLTNQREHDAVREGVKQAGIGGIRENGKGDAWFQDGAARHGSKSSARKAASARIARIPLPLSRWIARYYHPEEAAS